MLWLQILGNLFSWGKCVPINYKNIFATFVFTFKLKGGLNQIIFCVLLLVLFCLSFLVLLGCVHFSFALWPHFFSASSWSGFDCSNISALEEFLDNFSLMVWVRCFIICGGWFDELLIYVRLSFNFWYGR